MTENKAKQKVTFSKYQVFIIAVLSFIQFTVILDFMVLSPLGAQLMQELSVNPQQFGMVVSAYAFSAGIAGILAAGFADKFDRKKLLMFFYVGFVIGTLLCGLAPDYNALLVGRVVTGIFGGVISSVSFAIITDLFAMEMRGRVMGFVQMSFAASQVLGIPVGLLLANHFGWHAPFLMIVGTSILAGIIMVMYMKPVTEHLKLRSEKNAFRHLVKTVSKPDYLKGFLATTLLATGGFMLMPFGSAFSINNLKLTNEQLPVLYGITGVFSIIFGPLLGKLSDKIGKYNMFVIGSALTMLMVGIYTNMAATPLWIVIILNVILFVGISSRMISASALMSALPEPQDRGAFMGINSSVQQLSGGIAAAIAGMIVVKTQSGVLERYNILGYVVIAAMLITIGMMYFINKLIMNKKPIQMPQRPAVEETVVTEA
ncbi:MAG TPA: MFS transporter [Bacteroidia bacterium]|nr:MFS transporter [Bacteroidia bacterium]